MKCEKCGSEEFIVTEIIKHKADFEDGTLYVYGEATEFETLQTIKCAICGKEKELTDEQYSVLEYV